MKNRGLISHETCQHSLQSLANELMRNDVSKLPGNDRKWWHWKSNWWWVSAYNRDNFISIHFQTRMKSHNNVVGKNALRILLCAASLEWKFNAIAHFAMSNNLAGTVAIKICVGYSIKLFIEFQIHLYAKRAKKFKYISVTFSVQKRYIYASTRKERQAVNFIHFFVLLLVSLMTSLEINNEKHTTKSSFFRVFVKCKFFFVFYFLN